MPAPVRLLTVFAASAAVALAVGAPAQTRTAAKGRGWTRTYVLEWSEPAMYYGAKEGTTAAGTDCPGGTNPSPDWVTLMTDAGYSRKEAEWLVDPANPTRSPINGQAMLAFRGAQLQNVYDFPTTAKEVGLPPVTGSIAEGLDLDDDAKTGFVSPTGAKGIDNNFYKALGCWKTYRGPHRLSSGAMIENDEMREGAWTVVVVVSGTGKDPMNDPNVEIGFYDSADKIVRDGMGNVAVDYTFAIKPDRIHEAVFKGETRAGRVTGRGVGSVNLRNPAYDVDLPLLKAKLELQMKPDGTLSGLIGGYRPWLPIYKGWVAGRGPVIEFLTWVRMPDIYYALRRYADYSPSGPGGEKTYISFALKVDAVPAFVMEPDSGRQAAEVRRYRVRTMDAPIQMAGGATSAGVTLAQAQARPSGGTIE